MVKVVQDVQQKMALEGPRPIFFQVRVVEVWFPPRCIHSNRGDRSSLPLDSIDHGLTRLMCLLHRTLAW